MRKKLTKKEKVEEFVENYCNKFNNGLPRNNSGRWSSVGVDDFPSFINFIDGYSKKRICDVVSSNWFNKPALGYWSRKKIKDAVISNRNSDNKNDDGMKFDSGWFLKLSKPERRTFLCYIAENIRSDLAKLSSISPEIKKSLIRFGSDRVKRSVADSSYEHSAGYLNISSRQWRYMFDSATTMDFRVFCMSKIPKKKTKEYLRNKYSSISKLPWSISYRLQSSGVLTKSEISSLFSVNKTDDIDKTKLTNSEIAEILANQNSNVNSSNAKTKLRNILGSIEEMNVNMDQSYHLKRVIKHCIFAMPKEDILYFIGNDYLSDFEPAIQNKILLRKWG